MHLSTLLNFKHNKQNAFVIGNYFIVCRCIEFGGIWRTHSVIIIMQCLRYIRFIMYRF